MIEAVNKCPECGRNKLFINKEKGEIICKLCGYVIEDSLMDFGKERVIDNEDFEKRSRSGAPFDPRVANNLITEVGSNVDLFKLPKKTQIMIKRIRKKNRWTSSALEQNLNNGLGQLKIISGYLNIPDRVEKEAARLYRMAAEKGITRARSTEKLIAACVYVASKMQDMPKTLNEVAEASKLDKHVIAKTYKLLLRRLGMKLMPTSPVDFVGRFASELGLNPDIQTKTVKMIEKIQKMGLNSGKNPTSLAAVSLYITALLNKTKVTQTKIAKVSGITETTLRNRCKEMLDALDIKKKELKKR